MTEARDGLRVKLTEPHSWIATQRSEIRRKEIELGRPLKVREEMALGYVPAGTTGTIRRLPPNGTSRHSPAWVIIFDENIAEPRDGCGVQPYSANEGDLPVWLEVIDAD